MFKSPTKSTPTKSPHTAQKDEETSNTKVINDPVHGHIGLNKKLFSFIDHPIFQRLRDLKQLGGMYYVFPGASHNRFEHCLGTAYLAGKWIRKLKKSSPRVVLTEREIFLVEVAGLCHDLGHGPFSHTFEDCFVKQQNVVEFEHEDASVKLLKLINSEIPVCEEAHLEEKELIMVQNMITGKVMEGETRLFLYQIIHNQETGIDVDKFDYLARDCKSASLPLGYEYNRLLRYSKIVKMRDVERICFESRESLNLFSMFSTRASLHKQVYSHRVVKAIELMIGDVLKLADEHFQITETLKTISVGENGDGYNDALRTYSTFTDSLLNEIQRSRCDSLIQARNLLKRISVRDLYQQCNTNSVPDHMVGDVMHLLNESKIEICEDHCQIHELTFHKHVYDMGMKNINPLEKVMFYEGSQYPTPKPLEESCGVLNPGKSMEVHIRSYCKKQGIDSSCLEKLSKSISDMLVPYCGNTVSCKPSSHKKRKLTANDDSATPSTPANSSASRVSSENLKSVENNLITELDSCDTPKSSVSTNSDREMN